MSCTNGSFSFEKHDPVQDPENECECEGPNLQDSVAEVPPRHSQSRRIRNITLLTHSLSSILLVTKEEVEDKWWKKKEEDK